MLELLLNFFFPPRCYLCNEVLDYRQKWFCSGCKESLPYINGQSACKKCGMPMNPREDTICRRCAASCLYFKRGFAVFPYHENIREVIHRFKYENHKEYGQALALLMAEWIKDTKNNFPINEIDYLAPVPMYDNKEKLRGYNQAEVLASWLSRYTEIPLKSELICRVKNTKEQNKLTALEREANMQDAFQIKNMDCVKGKKLLLIDDIYTTGSTMNAISRQLVTGGAEKVWALCLSITEAPNVDAKIIR